VRAPDISASTHAASSGAEQGWKRSGPRWRQAGAAEAGTGSEHEAWGGGGCTDGGEVGPVRIQVGRRWRGDLVAAAEEDGLELTQVVVVRVRVHWCQCLVKPSDGAFGWLRSIKPLVVDCWLHNK